MAIEVVAITLVTLARSKTVDAVTGSAGCIVGKTANAVEREHRALRQHTEDCARKSLLRNRSLENGVRSGKLKTLRRRGAWNCDLRRSHGHHQRCYPTRCLISGQIHPLALADRSPDPSILVN